MANKYAGGVKAGSTSVSTDVLMLSAADGSELTGKVAADFTLSYRRQGAARVSVSTAPLALLTTAWTDGGVKEDMGGLYRVDFPNAAFAAGADYVMLTAQVSGSQVFHERIPLETVGAAEAFASLAALPAQVRTEAAAALMTDTYGEPGQGAPAVTASLGEKINYLYKAWRNRSTQTDAEYALYANDSTTKDQRAIVSDDDTTFDRREIVSGP